MAVRSVLAHAGNGIRGDDFISFGRARPVEKFPVVKDLVVCLKGLLELELE
jgi:hypothetical protein